MKVVLNTLIGIVSIAVFLCGFSSIAFAQGANTLQVNQDPDLQAIRNNTLIVKGMKFPKLPSQSNLRTSGPSCCNVGDTRTQDVFNPFRKEEQAAKKGKVTHESTTPYSPPLTCWVISSHKLTVLSARGASYHLTAAPAGYSFVTSNQYQQTYEDVKNLVLNMNILDKYKIDIVANLKQFTNNYASYSQSLSVSHGSLLLYVKLEGQGIFNGRSWFEGTVTDTETCCPPQITDPVALRTALTTWVENTVNALPNKGRGPGRILNYGNIIGVPIDQKDMKGYVFTPGATPTPTPR
ncbi:MAG: hypothetical protein AABN95_21895 [Acidobacteriota bacterium]